MQARKFIIKLFLFITPLLIVCFTVEYQLRKIPNTYMTKNKLLSEQSDSIKILVLGTSHALNGIDPEYFSLYGFNLAHSAQPIYYDAALTLKLLPKLKQLRLVIIPIDYYALYYKITSAVEGWRAFYYYQFWGIDNADVAVFDSRKYSLFMLYGKQETLNLIRNRFKVDYTKVINLNKFGFWVQDTINRDLAQTINDSVGFLRAKVHNDIIMSATQKDQDDVVSQLEILVKTLSEHNVKFAFVTAPVWKTYSKYCLPEVIQKSHEILGRLCLRYHCSYFDYSSDPRYVIDDFYDNDHLNKYGAKKFSLMLNDEIVKPQLIGK